MTQHLSPTTAALRLRQAVHDLTELAALITVAYRELAKNQPGIASGGDGAHGKGGHADPTGTMAISPGKDPARARLDELDHLVRTIAGSRPERPGAISEALRIARQWQPPRGQWRDALATEAAAKLGVDDRPGCRCCAQLNRYEPTREGGTLCDWCDRWVRDIAGSTTTSWLLPRWFVERHAQGRRITTRDRANAEAEWRAYRGKRKGRRSA